MTDGAEPTITRSVLSITVNGVTITLTDEIGTSHKPASISISGGGDTVKYNAVIEKKQGADGGFYPCVVFQRGEG